MGNSCKENSWKVGKIPKYTKEGITNFIGNNYGKLKHNMEKLLKKFGKLIEKKKFIRKNTEIK